MILVLIGLASGIISGMGIGGGAILIPALILYISPPQHIAQSVNLLFFIPTAIVALVIHIKNKRIEFKTAIPIIISGIIGAGIGAAIAVSLPGPVLRKWFGFFLLAMGLYEIFGKKSPKKSAENARAK